MRRSSFLEFHTHLHQPTSSQRLDMEIVIKSGIDLVLKNQVQQNVKLSV